MKYPIDCDCCDPPVIFKNRHDKFYHLNRRSNPSNLKMKPNTNNKKRLSNDSDAESTVSKSNKKLKSKS